jgi:hypothetical protein
LSTCCLKKGIVDPPAYVPYKACLCISVLLDYIRYGDVANAEETYIWTGESMQERIPPPSHDRSYRCHHLRQPFRKHMMTHLQHCQGCNKLHSFSLLRHSLVCPCQRMQMPQLYRQSRSSVDYYYANGSCLLVILSAPSAPSIGRFCTGILRRPRS